jgi:hypothetical protein
MTNENELTLDELDHVSAATGYVPPGLARDFQERALRSSLETELNAIQSFKMPSFSFF